MVGQTAAATASASDKTAKLEEIGVFQGSEDCRNSSIRLPHVC